jgi:hypothetical protein
MLGGWPSVSNPAIRRFDVLGGAGLAAIATSLLVAQPPAPMVNP